MTKPGKQARKAVSIRYREKIKEDEEKWLEYKKKDAKRKAEYRKRLSQKLKSDGILLRKKREMDRIRQQAKRQKKNAVRNSNSNGEAYSCKQTLSKALKKVEAALPKDLNKKIAVLKSLFNKYIKPTDLMDENTIQSSKTQAREKLIETFYLQDGISVEAPGRKDTMTVDGEVVAKRVMLMTLTEAYQLFKAEYTGEKVVCKTIFCQSKPIYINLVDDLRHNMCVCKYHANFTFLLEGCAKIIPQISPKSDLFLKRVCCDVKNERCMTNECESCVSDIIDELVPIQFITKMQTQIKWKQWRRIDNRVTLNSTIGPLMDLIHDMQTQLPAFKMHCFVKREQQKYFEEKKKNLAPNEIVMQVDFAENYRLTCQNEIQDAHFSYSQVTIFTCVAWVLGETKSFAVISDRLTHNKFDVNCFISKIISILKNKYKAITSIYMFSDGSSSQFKNKFIISVIPRLAADFHCSILQWNFFATSHGKGAVDGVGAVVKRKVWQIVKATNIVLGDAPSFYECATNNINGVNILYISGKEIDSFSNQLVEIWQNVPNIKGIKSFHSFSYCDNQFIEASRTAYTVKKKLKI